MGNWNGISRAALQDARARRNWNRLATAIESLLASEQFDIVDGKLTLTSGVAEGYSAYDATGGMEVTSSPRTVRYDTEVANSNSSVFTALVNGEVTVAVSEAEVFSFYATVSLEHREDSDPDFQCRVWLERDDGTGWAEVIGSEVHVGSDG